VSRDEEDDAECFSLLTPYDSPLTPHASRLTPLFAQRHQTCWSPSSAKRGTDSWQGHNGCCWELSWSDSQWESTFCFSAPRIVS